MNIALFETRAEADGFAALLGDVIAVDSVVVPARRGFAVDVLRPADFVAGVIYVLYYVKGFVLADLAARPRDERLELLRDHLIHYAVGGRRWDPPAVGLRWYAEHAALEPAEIEAVVADARAGYRRG